MENDDSPNFHQLTVADCNCNHSPSTNYTFGWPSEGDVSSYEVVLDTERTLGLVANNSLITISLQGIHAPGDLWTENWLDLEYSELFPTALKYYIELTRSTEGASLAITDEFIAIWRQPFQTSFQTIQKVLHTQKAESGVVSSSTLTDSQFSVFSAIVELENLARLDYPDDVQNLRKWEWNHIQISDNRQLLLSSIDYTKRKNGTLVLSAVLVNDSYEPQSILTMYVNDTISNGIPDNLFELLICVAQHAEVHVNND